MPANPIPGSKLGWCDLCLADRSTLTDAFFDVYAVFLGYTGWAAGSFETPYVLSETPTKNGGSWIDQLLVKACMAPIVNNYVALG